MRIRAAILLVALSLAFPWHGVSEDVTSRHIDGVLAQVNTSPPIIKPPTNVPKPLDNRPERTQGRDDSKSDTDQAQSPNGQGLGDDPTASPENIEPNIVIFSLSGNADVDTSSAIAADHQLTILSERRLTSLGQRILRLSIPDTRTVSEVLQAAAADTRIEASQPSYVYNLQTVSSSPGLQYTVDQLRLTECHAIARGKNVRVALIDARVERKHDELRRADIRILSVLETAEAQIDDHGTQMAGIIVSADRVTGVAPLVQLTAIEAFHQSAKRERRATSNSYLISAALDQAASERAQVINMSFAGAEDPLVSKILRVLSTRGLILIAAAGNNGPGAPVAHPAGHRDVIAVTAVGSRTELFAQSNQGSYIDLAAPGIDVIVPAMNGGYTLSSGTSVAAAHVTGIVALMLEQNPKLTQSQLLEIIKSSADDLGPAGVDEKFGAGMINPLFALRRARQVN